MIYCCRSLLLDQYEYDASVVTISFRWDMFVFVLWLSFYKILHWAIENELTKRKQQFWHFAHQWQCNEIIFIESYFLPILSISFQSRLDRLHSYFSNIPSRFRCSYKCHYFQWLSLPRKMHIERAANLIPNSSLHCIVSFRNTVDLQNPYEENRRQFRDLVEKYFYINTVLILEKAIEAYSRILRFA